MGVSWWDLGRLERGSSIVLSWEGQERGKTYRVTRGGFSGNKIADSYLWQQEARKGQSSEFSLCPKPSENGNEKWSWRDEMGRPYIRYHSNTPPIPNSTTLRRYSKFNLYSIYFSRGSLLRISFCSLEISTLIREFLYSCIFCQLLKVFVEKNDCNFGKNCKSRNAQWHSNENDHISIIICLH